MTFQRSFENRTALLDAALEEFVECGYEGASLNRILRTSGVSKGQLYHHFDGKRGLYLGVVDELIARKRTHFEAHLVPPGANLFATLAAQLRAGLDFAKEHPEFERFGRSFLAERGRPIFTEVLKTRGLGSSAPIESLVSDAEQRGELHPTVGRDFAVRTIATVLEMGAERLGHAGEVERVIAFLERGLGR